MSFLTNIFVIGSYVIIALALSMGLQAFAGVEPVVGWLAAAVFFLFAAQIHGTLNRAQENAILSGEIMTLRQVLAASEQDLEAMTERLDDMAGRVEGVGDVRNRRLSSEMKVLESLVQQFASGIAERTAERQKSVAPDQIADSNEIPNEDWKVGKFDKANPSAFDRATDKQLLTAVRESLAENRVDLYLQPVVSLPQRRLRFYEALTRLRADSGEILMPRHYLRVAEDAGLMSTVDNLLLFRSVQIIRKLMDSENDARMFCNISSSSLQDKIFFPQFLDFMEANADLKSRLIFEFAQDTIDMCGPLELANLRRLTGLGFRFSLDQVSTLDIDAVALRDRGFGFVKVPVDVLIDRLTAPDAPADVAEIKMRLARHGIDLIAEKIENDRAIEAVIGASVDFGQGYLLGEPLPAASESLAATTADASHAGAAA